MYFNQWDSLDRLEYLLTLPYEKSSSGDSQQAIDRVENQQSLHVEANKLNIIQAAKNLSNHKVDLPKRLIDVLKNVEKSDQNVQVRVRAKELLLTLNK